MKTTTTGTLEKDSERGTESGGEEGRGGVVEREDANGFFVFEIDIFHKCV